MRKQGLFILLLPMSFCSMMRAQTSFTYGGLNYTVLSEADGTAIVGKNAPSREIFLQKEWFSQILCSNLPCHWWFLLVLICSTKVGEKSDMAKSLTARLAPSRPTRPSAPIAAPPPLQQRNGPNPWPKWFNFGSYCFVGYTYLCPQI